MSVYLFATGRGGFVGGPAAARIGPRRVIILSLIAAVTFGQTIAPISAATVSSLP